MPAGPVPPPRRVSGAGAVTIGALIAGLGGYLLHLPASRWLGPDGYGAFAALLSAQLLVAVPALALQAVVAREIVRGAPVSALRTLGLRTTAVMTMVVLALIWPVHLLLVTPVGATAAALVSGPVLCLVAVEQGVLQGRSRFGALGLSVGATGLVKVVPPIAVLAAGGGVGAALTLGAVGAGLAWPLTRVLVSRRLGSGGAGVSGAVGASTGSAHESDMRVLTVVAASQVQLVVVTLTSIDVLLARALLSPDDAGRYALGAIVAKGAFWLPQAVGTVLYPRMADPAHGREALRTAVRVLLAIGSVLIVGVALAAPLAPLVAGPRYQPVAGLLWAFAALGVTCSLLQALLHAAIAVDRTREALTAWVGLVVLVCAVWLVPRSVEWVLAAALTTVVTTTTVAGVRAWTVGVGGGSAGGSAGIGG